MRLFHLHNYVSHLGDWVIVWTHLAKQFGYYQNLNTSTTTTIRWSEISLESLMLKGLWSFWWPSLVISYGMYFLIGGFIHVSNVKNLMYYYYYYYISKKKETLKTFTSFYNNQIVNRVLFRKIS